MSRWLPRPRAVIAAVVAIVVATSGALTAGRPAGAAVGNGSPNDPNVRYFGRWEVTSPTTYVSRWAGAYLEVGFTGTTVKLRQRNTIDLFASIDGGPDVAYTNVSGTVDLTPTRLAAGNHTLRVSYRPVAGSYRGDAVFQGLVLDAGARTFAPPVSPTIVEFVGDSITVGQQSSKQALTAYGWLVGERLGVAHTQVAQGGACLVAAPDGCVGLSRQFFKVSSLADAPDWDFTRYQASAVVINLGTNDVGHAVSTTTFQATYTTFLRDIRHRYPNAVIFAMQNFKQRYAAQTRTAVQSVVDGGDRNVVYVDTAGWNPSTTDGTHPDDAGHRSIADRLAPIIAARLPTGCVDATARSTADDAPVQLWTCNGGPNQRWTRR